MIYSKTGTVTASMCDGKVRLSNLAIFQLEEDAVTDLMGDLHIDGVTAMREYNAMWVFVKNVIRIYQRPEWRTALQIRAFISSHSAAKLLIDTEILAGEDLSPVARCRLELCALDMQTGSIRKASTVGIQEDTPCFQALPDLKYSRFQKQEKEDLSTLTVRSTNLDYCSHTNNIEYIRFMLNTYQARELLENEIEQVEVHYGKQTFEGDELTVSRHRASGEDYFSVSSKNGVAVDCLIKWK